MLQNPPNFLIEAELRTYVTPVVILPEEEQEPDQMDGFLVDTSDTTSTHNEMFDSGHRNGSISPEQSIAERLENYLCLNFLPGKI